MTMLLNIFATQAMEKNSPFGTHGQKWKTKMLSLKDSLLLEHNPSRHFVPNNGSFEFFYDENSDKESNPTNAFYSNYFRPFEYKSLNGETRNIFYDNPSELSDDESSEEKTSNASDYGSSESSDDEKSDEKTSNASDYGSFEFSDDKIPGEPVFWWQRYPDYSIKAKTPKKTALLLLATNHRSPEHKKDRAKKRERKRLWKGKNKKTKRGQKKRKHRKKIPLEVLLEQHGCENLAPSDTEVFTKLIFTKKPEIPHSEQIYSDTESNSASEAGTYWSDTESDTDSDWSDDSTRSETMVPKKKKKNRWQREAEGLLIYFRNKYGNQLQGGTNYETMKEVNDSEDDINPMNMHPRSQKNKFERKKKFDGNEKYIQLY